MNRPNKPIPIPRRAILRLLAVLSALLFACGGASYVSAQSAVVRAVLFYSPSCPHCHEVITVALPPLFEKYGDQLQIVGVDTSTQGGHDLYLAAFQSFGLPDDRRVVPILFIGDVTLTGSLDIPEQLPGLIETYLAQGGVDWPDIPGLREALGEAQSEATAEPTPPAATPTPAEAAQAAVAPTAIAGSPESALILPESPALSLAQRLALDPVGNGLSIVVLIGMIVSVGGAAALLLNSDTSSYPEKPSWAIPILCALGLVIAFYLAYVETQHVDAVCGPVGDCNSVQQSEYAVLFGVLPVGMLGLAGYVAIVIAWAVSRFASGRIASLASAALLVMATFGVLFSIYLTFLEPFVIGATCAWCLSSAVIMTALLWLAVRPGRLALSNLLSGGSGERRRSR